MKRLFLTYIIAIISISLFSQIATVKNNVNLEPIEFATLYSAEKDIYIVSGNKGEVDINDFIGASQIEIRMMGYYTIIMSYEQILNNNLTIYLTQSSITLDQVVVSATKWEQSQRDIPTKITTISAKDISYKNPQTSADLLAASGDVYVQKSQQGGGSPLIRGFATNRLVIAVDGVRMNTAIFRAGNIQNVISIDPLSVEYTEVLFGPGSVTYGSDAIGGVMSFRTFAPKFGSKDDINIGGKANFRMSSANQEMTGHFDVNIGWEKFALFTSVSHNSFGDLKMGSFGPEEYLRTFFVKRIDGIDYMVNNPNSSIQTPTAYSQNNFLQKIRFKPNKRWELNYGFYYSESSNNPRYDRLLQLNDSLPKYSEWYYGPQIWMMNNLNIRHYSENKLYDEMIIIVAHQHFEESRHTRKFNSETLTHRIENVEALSCNIDFSKTLSENDELFYGFEAIYNLVSSIGQDENITTNSFENAASRYPESNWSSYAIYSTYKHDFNEKIDIVAGLRYNQFLINAIFDTIYYPLPMSSMNINKGSISGSVGFVYNPKEDWSISINTSTGFRTPNIDDVGKVFDSEPGAVVVPNSQLNAEYAYNAEFSIAKIFGRFMKLQVSTYYTYLDNALVRRDYSLNGKDSIYYDGELSRVQAIQNAAFAQVYGVQSALEIKLPVGFGLSSRFSWQKGFEELDDGSVSPLRHASPWFGYTELSYSAKSLKLGFYSIYAGLMPFEDMPDSEILKTYLYAKDENGNPYSPAWLTFNLRAMYQIDDSFAVTIALENITDQLYRPYSSGLVASGRNLVVGVKASF